MVMGWKVALVTGVVAALFALRSGGAWFDARRSRRRLAREHARLFTMGTGELARAAGDAATRWFPHLPAATVLGRAGAKTDRDLVAELDALWDEVNADDRRRGRSGRGSSCFEFYDAGLASILEALKERLDPTGRPPT